MAIAEGSPPPPPHPHRPWLHVRTHVRMHVCMHVRTDVRTLGRGCRYVAAFIDGELWGSQTDLSHNNGGQLTFTIELTPPTAASSSTAAPASETKTRSSSNSSSSTHTLTLVAEELGYVLSVHV